MYEDELIPLFEKCGAIWDLRLMMDPMTGLNRGYAFVTFTNRDGAHEAVKQVKIRPFLILILNICLTSDFLEISCCSSRKKDKYSKIFLKSKRKSFSTT